MELRAHQKANNDFFEAYFYYEAKSPGLGEHFYTEVKAAYLIIQDHPLKQRILKGIYLVLNLKTFPFQIIYSYSKILNRISIFAIYHNSKNPKKKFRKF